MAPETERALTGADPTRARYDLAFEAGRMGTWSWEIATGAVDWDEHLCRVFGVDRSQAPRDLDSYATVLHPDDRDAVFARVSAAVEGGEDLQVEHRALRPDGEVIWIRGSGRLVRDAEGNPAVMVGVAMDVTAARRLAEDSSAARAAAEDSGRRLRVLAAAGEVLGASLDVDVTVQEVADLVVREHLGDWCAVDVVADGGDLVMLAVAHRDPERLEFARRLRERYPPEDSANPALVTGEPQLYPEIPDEMLVAAARDEDHLGLMRELGMGSAVVAPLVARGRVIGSLTLVASKGGRPYDDSDVVLASELARRAAVAIDNARVYNERDRAARTLQASLLPPSMPTVPGIELAAHYRPAGSGLAIGGDFYDVFPVDATTWCLVIGDVCGKGAEAAAMTSAARYSLRAAVIRERDPGLALGVLNESLLAEDWQGRYCTAAVVLLRTGADGGVRATMATGGHPAPVVLRAGGVVEVPPVEGLLVGVLEHSAPDSVSMVLAPGDALVMYTDGLTEARRGPDLFGDQRLHAALAAASAADAEHLADAVLAAVDEFDRGVHVDDMALVVARVAC